MRKLVTIVFCISILCKEVSAQSPISLKCDKQLKKTIQTGLLFDNYMERCNNYYLLKNIDCLKQSKLISIYDSTRLYTNYHNTWNLYAFINEDDCSLIIPDTLAEINRIVQQELHLTRYDVAYISIFFLAPQREIIFPSNKVFKKYTSRSNLFITFYSSNYFNLKLSGFKKAIHSSAFHKDYYKLMKIDDSSITIVITPNKQEQDSLYKIKIGKSMDVRNRLDRTSLLMTIIYEKDNTVKEVRRQYFIPKLKKYKNKGMHFYDSLGDLVINEQE